MAAKFVLFGRYRWWVPPVLGCSLVASIVCAALGWPLPSYLMLALAFAGALLACAGAEQRARQGGDLFRLLFDRSPFGVVSMDKDYRLRAANPALVRLLGAGSERELLDAALPTALSQQPAALEAAKRVRLRKRAQSFETSWRLSLAATWRCGFT